MLKSAVEMEVESPLGKAVEPAAEDVFVLPTSHAQRRLWFLDRLEPGGAVYNVPLAHRLDGPLDPAALVRALRALAERHEVLRTTFSVEGEEPVQVVSERPRAALPVVDLGRLPGAAAEAEADRLTRAAALRPFDLAAGPLLRARLLRLPSADSSEKRAERHRFLLEMHHTVCDGWSLGVLRRELAALYRDQDADLPELPIQYGDYAAWQEEWLESDERDRQLDWWRERLDGMPEVMELPFAGPRPAVRDRRGGRRSRTVPEPLAASLEALARAAGATRFMVYLAAWKLLLHRLAPEVGRAGDGDDRRPDATVGVPVAGRALEETEGLIGLFVNTLVLRTRLAGCSPGGAAPSFREIVARVKDGMLAALSHQDLPFESLVEELVPERDLSYEPLVQVTFGLEEGGAPGSDPFGLPGVRAEALPTDHDRMKVDLALLIEEGAQVRGGWRATLSYTADLFRPADAERLLRCYQTLLAAVAADPERPVSELPVMDPGERHRVLYEWADGGAEPFAEIAPEGSAATIHGLVEAAAARAPERVAVAGSHEGGGGGRTLSYREVVARAHRLADHLRTLGVAPGDRVGVSLPRSPRLVPALLGVLRAGAAYVPLDPEYPEERLAFIVDDASIRLMVTEPGTAERLSGVVADRSVRLLLLSESGEPNASIACPDPTEPTPPRPVEVSPDALAYLIYTSGSTGRPKGVAIPHRSAAAMILWAGGLYGPSGRDDFAGLFAATSISFDLSVFELFAPLAAGGRVTIGADVLALFDSATAADARGSARLLNTVPSAIAELVRGEAVPDSVRTVNLAGEPLKRDLVDRIYACPGVEAVYNLYGPSEDTTYSTFERVPRDAPEEPAIGRPLAGTRALVLDRDLRPVPAGVAGELFLAGAGVARGYLGRPEATAESFLPDPFTAAAGGRMYRTGDRVIHLPDGRLAFRGRLDHQVKLRGFRIELGEIETALTAHPEVAEAAVLFRRGDEAAGGDQSDRLVAYYEPPEGCAAPPPEALAAHLAERLPAYMIPSAWAALDALPLTPNGKIDRKALAAIEASTATFVGEGGGAPGAERTGPRTREERIVAEVWADLLGLDEVSARDDFFAVGGHSLLATRMTARLRQRTGVELPLRRVFERRTVAGIAAALAEVGGRAAEAPPLVPAARDTPLPASFAQERLWFLDRLGDPDAAYNLPIPQRLSGPLDPAALAAALAGVARRHEVLRTVFRPAASDEAAELAEAAAVQIVRPPAPRHPLPVIDLDALAAPVREAELTRLAREEAGRPFDLAADPMMRTLLVRLDGRRRDDHALLLTLHHIAGDGWSASVLFRELAALYGGAAPDRPSADLPELPVRYADFALWQRRYLSGETLERELGFWRWQLAGAPPVLPLPTDRPRPAQRTQPAATVSWQLSRRATDGLRTLARERGASLFVALLAGFQALLHRTTGATDLPVGTPVANRTRPEIENLVGFFVNTLVLRSDLAGDPTFGELVERVREVAMYAFAHQDLPFERLVQELSPERSLSHAPLVQVMLSLQNVPPMGAELPPAPSAGGAGPVRREHLPLPSRSAKLDLTVAAHEVEEGAIGLDGQAELDRELFDPTTVRRLLRAFVHLLEAAAEDPDRRLSELPLVAGAERHQLLHEWNDTRSDYPREPLGALLAARIEATPDAVAAVFSGTDSGAGGDRRPRTLSYGALGRRGARLAARLAAHGAGPDVPVGIAVDRSVEMLAALAGIVATGAAYVPLDPDYPQDRLRLMLEDTGAPIVVTAGAVSPGLETVLAGNEAGTGAARVDLLETDLEIGEAPPEAAFPAADVSPASLAYVTYTSGSTGRPKGVAVPQSAVARLVFQDRFAEFGPERRVGLASTLAFDAATFEVWGALLHGATLVGLDQDTVLDAERLACELVRHRVTTLFLTTALFHQLVRSAEETGSLAPVLAGMDDLLFGGEACDPERVRGAVEALAGSSSSCHLRNVYGPTESTTFAATHRVREVPADAASVPIGRPIANTAAHVTDRTLSPVPAGIGAELVLGGDGLARGYWNRPADTAERFVPDPLSGRPGARLYRTGDLVRRDAAGRIDFQGRFDHQVKIRGFRIELGEIESWLARHPAVAAQVVAVREDVPGSQRLVAYVVPETESERDAGLDAAALRAYLAESLPEFMVPAAVVLLDELPLDPNGKVDREALPAPEETGGAGAARPAFVPPRGPLEEMVAEAWSELLPVTRVGAHDSFFELGGHSLLATRVVSRLRRLTGVEIPLRSLFENPTVAGLALCLEGGSGETRRTDGAEKAPPLEPRSGEDRERETPASFAQERLWFLGRYGADRSQYNVPSPVRVDGPLVPSHLARGLAEVVRRHEALRTVFARSVRDETGVVQRVLAAGSVPLPVIDLAGLPAARREAEVRRLAAADAGRSFDLAVGPLLRTGLVRLAREDHLLLFCQHHIVTDGWSLAILFRELEILYGALREGRRPPSQLSELPELPAPDLQYGDYALWQRRWLSGETLERQVSYWRERLAGVPAVLDLPTDRPRPPVQTLRGGEVRVHLSAGLRDAVRALARRHGVSLFMALLAGFQAVLGRLSGAAEVPIGAPIAGRTHAETEDLIGFFVNTLVFRGELAGDPGFDELLARTRDGALDAYAHQELPFEKLVEELRPERNLAHSPIFQVMFALQNTPPPVLSLAGTRGVRPYEAGGYRAAKFDLTLALVETAQGALAGDLSYNRDLFDATTVRRLMAHLATLLAGAAANPERRLSDLPLLGDAERHHLLREWNDTALAPPESPAERTLHGRVALHTAEAPDRVALVASGAAGDDHLTYGELDARAERLARTLAARGVGPGVPVGIHLGRRPEMAVAVLAVEKAGGAYVPLETTWPLDRIGWIAEEHGIRHLVTESSRLEAMTGLPDRRAETGEPRFVNAADAHEEDTSDAPLPGEPGGAQPVDPEDPAYVIFTSGSTGRPKGVLVRHRPAAALVSWVNDTFGVGPDDRLLFVTALSFDLSVYDLFGTLSAGGTVRLATTAELDDPVRQVERMVADRITFWDSAPAALQRLAPLFPDAAPPASAAAAMPASSPALRLVFLSGDWVPLALPDRVREGFPGARVIALGGATEATVWSNYFPVGEVPPDWPSIPYGRPISNARYHVLGPTLRPCAIGAAGDLFIAGGCLSSGYVDNPRQTAWSYLPDPFADRSPGGEPGAVLYRTGDRARYLPDGDLEFLGRLDSQVKVRGFRIELGEIESVLNEHPAVADAVALAREDVPGDQRLVAYLIPADREAGPPAPEELRTWALRKLPEYMIPTAWVFRDEWPLSPTGKLDRKALPAPGAAEPGAGGEQAPITPARSPVERAVAEVWRDVLGVPEVGRDQNFFDLGGHSLLLARVQERLEERLGREVPMVELFRHPTVASVAAALDTTSAEAAEAEAPARRTGPAASGAVAVVGMAGRFPGARDVDELWRNLRAGVESIRFFDDEELEAAGHDRADLRDPALVKARGALDDPDLFDARFFGYSPREAEILDPQHRLFLEASWQALEDAGRGAAGTSQRLSGSPRGHRVGVFGGMTESTYQRLVRSDAALVRAVGGHQIAISGNPDYLASRVSYKLGLTGPSVAVQTACSTSLVAVHMACRSLLEGACDLALAGGVSVQAREVSPYRWAEGGIGSPDGHVRAFDAEAGGVVGGSGVGVVALKRLEDAVADGDTIRAVIRGSAINNDGALKAGFTAPSAEGQAEVIREALEAAGVEPRTVGYVEAHGTATRLGDPIEISGLARAFAGGDRAPGQGSGEVEKTCVLGSVKTNVGHLDAAAGVTGLIKAVLALQHGEIPPSLHYRSPNPEIDFASTPFYVADRLIPFERNGAPRRAGVSAFGIGGTNAHAVLEEAPRRDEAPDDESAAGAAAERGAELLVLSAKSPEAADRAVERLAEHLERRAEDGSGACDPPELADVAWTLQAGRAAFPHRRAVVAPRPQIGPETGPALAEAARALRERDRRSSSSAAATETPPPVVFLFPGQGAQFPGMAEALYREEPLFREAIDHAADVLEPEIGGDLRELLFPEDPSSRRAEDALAATEVTQPALFAVEHALMLLWESWGVTPAATVGHSLGEYTAAVRAGVFELDDALRLVAARGRLMASRPGGAMLGVRLGPEELVAEMAEMAVDEMALAAVNGAESCVVSGPAEPVAELRERLEARNVGCKPLHTSHAFHSPLMEPVVDAFEELVARVGPRAPELPFVSNVTGTWITADEARDPGYWARHLRRPVLFDDGLATLLGHFEEGNEPFLLEVGPGRTLTDLARRHRLSGRGRGFQPSMRRARQMGSDRERMLTALGALWTAGVEVDWAGHHAGARRRRVPLPTYPFERRSFWVGAQGAGKRAERREAEPTARPETAETPELSGVRGEVAVAFRELLGVAPAAEEDFFDLGGSSLMAVQLGARLREISGVELPSDFLLQASTPAALAELIESRRAAAGAGEAPASTCLVPLRKSGSRTPLFLVHQVGGNVFSYRALAKELPAAQPIYALRSPGLEPGEETLGSVEEMAERYLELVLETQPRGPYRIGGASMGGMIAFEMAHRLTGAGETVELLTLMDSPCGDQMPPKPESDYDITAGVYMGPGRLAPEEVEGMDAEEQLRYAVEKARKDRPETGADSGQSFERELEQLRRLAAVLRANIDALFAYRPEPWDGRAIFFRAGEKRPGEPPRPERPWIELARGGIEIHVVPGNHTTMHEPPNVETLARRLDRALRALADR